MDWAGSKPRGNCFLRMTYAEAEKSPHEIIEKIKWLPTFKPEPIHNQPLQKPPRRRIWHAVERHEDTDPATIERKRIAWESWDAIYDANGMIPAHLWAPPRSAKDIGSVRDLPYLKDILSHAMEQAGDEDIIVFTNDDNFLHPDLPDILQFYVSTWGAVCSQRCEFKTRMPIGSRLEEYARRSEGHIGRDLFAFKKSWLAERWNDIPDFILGAQIWDLCMCAMIRLQFGIKTDRRNLITNYFPSELPRGYISHQYHKPRWSDPDIENVDPAEHWNKALFKAWAAKNLPELHFTPQNTI
jgi:hypothetical protein